MRLLPILLFVSILVGCQQPPTKEEICGAWYVIACDEKPPSTLRFEALNDSRDARNPQLKIEFFEDGEYFIENYKTRQRPGFGEWQLTPEIPMIELDHIFLRNPFYTHKIHSISSTEMIWTATGDWYGEEKSFSIFFQKASAIDWTPPEHEPTDYDDTHGMEEPPRTRQ